MKTITIPKPNSRSSYLLWVLEHGHVPGVLSGRSLRGNARRWGASYHKQRLKAISYAAVFGVFAERQLIGAQGKRRWCVVWTKDGEPVKIVIDGNLPA